MTIPHIVPTVKIADIKLPEDHPPLGDVSAFITAIRIAGVVTPIQLTRDMVLISGSHTLEACRQLGWEEIPAVFIKDTDLPDI